MKLVHSDYLMLVLVYMLNMDQVVCLDLVQNSLQASQLMDLSGRYYYLLHF